MSLWLFLRKAALGCSLALGIPAAAVAQTGYSTNGAEYPIAGALLGDQMRPQLSLSSGGGYAVWEDNGLNDGNLSIRAIGLDNTLAPVLAPFQVSQTRGSSQERPQVALLKDGGAVFVWQSVRRGAYNVVARFISPTNSWATGEVPVNVAAGNFFKPATPAVATLANGNVIVVWASFNQVSSSSMQDIYGQLFKPSGQKIGREFLVNQFVLFNQRTPAVVPLADGGFAVAWVSEQQRNAPANTTNTVPAAITAGGIDVNRASIDVYARRYEASGAPRGNEFIVNTDSDLCANPNLAPTADGGFMAAWSQKDPQAREKSWDVFVRCFPGSGDASAVKRVNAWLFGDQFAPQLSAVGTEFLAVWTSLAQDGSEEGVYGRFLQGDGSPVGSEFRVNTATVGAQKQPALASDGAGRFLAAWTSFAGLHRGFDLFAQAYATPDFIMPAPVTNYVAPVGSLEGSFAAQTPPNPMPEEPGLVGDSGDGPSLAYPVPSSFSGVINTNGFADAKGSYRGLFYNPVAVAVTRSGAFTATATERGAYTAQLRLGTRTFPFSGKFSSIGLATNRIPRGASLPALIVRMQLDLAGGDQIRGTVTDGIGTADLLADRLVWSKTAHPATDYVGSYTVVVPPGEAGPSGIGYGTAKVSASGSVQFNGSLADGTPFAIGSAVSKAGVWPVYAPLYGSTGSFIGWLHFAAQTDRDLNGQVLWFKPANPRTKNYPAGFTNQVWAAGSRYTAQPASARALSLSAAFPSVILSGGPLAQPSTNSLSLPKGKVSLSVTPASGMFRGTTVNPDTGKALSFRGVVFEKGSFGAGYFLDRNQSGEAYVTPVP